MNAIANSAHVIDFPTHAVPKAALGSSDAQNPEWSVRVSPSAIDVMQRCLKYRKEHRLTIPELLQHELLKPKVDGESGLSTCVMCRAQLLTEAAPNIPPGATTITPAQMAMLVGFIVKSNGRALPPGDTTAAVSPPLPITSIGECAYSC